MLVTKLAFFLTPLVALAAPTPSPVHGALAPRATPPQQKDVKYHVSGFSAASTPHSVSAYYDFKVKSVDADNDLRAFDTECSGRTETYQSLGFVEGACQDESVSFKFRPLQSGDFRVTVIKQWDLDMGAVAFSYNDTAHHLITKDHYHRHAGITPTGDYVSIDDSSEWDMNAKAMVVAVDEPGSN